MDRTADAAGHDAFILGSAIHGGAWLPEAAEFVRGNVKALVGRPVWLLRVSSLGEESAAFSPAMARRLRAMRKEAKGMPDLRVSVAARDHHDFAGVVRPEDWGLPGRAFMTAMRGRYGDHRNWPAIDRWAAGIARELVGQPDRSA